MLKIVVHGFLSGPGFLLAIAALALVLHNPLLAFIPVVLLGAYWHRHHAGDFRSAIAAIRASRGQRRDLTLRPLSAESGGGLGVRSIPLRGQIQ